MLFRKDGVCQNCKKSVYLIQFQYTAGVNIEWLENKQREIGDSVARVEELQKELNEFEDKALVS